MRIIGTGSALPEKVVTNDMLAGFLDTSDNWITTRTGIRTRRLLSTETLRELALEAAKKAIASSGLTPADIDYLICSNVANSYVSPSLGSIILGQLGCCCPTFDMNGACAGLVYSLDVADAFLKSGRARNILVVAAEQPSRFCDWHDRSTSVLFGDGASALVVTGGEGFFDFRLTGNTHTDVMYYKRSLEPTPYDRVEERTQPLVMEGREVFRLAVESCIEDVDVRRGLGRSCGGCVGARRTRRSARRPGCRRRSRCAGGKRQCRNGRNGDNGEDLDTDLHDSWSPSHRLRNRDNGDVARCPTV